jgi:hypothetical protein
MVCILITINGYYAWGIVLSKSDIAIWINISVTFIIWFLIWGSILYFSSTFKD